MNSVLEMEGGGLKPRRKKVGYAPGPSSAGNAGNVMLNGKGKECAQLGGPEDRRGSLLLALGIFP